MTRIEKAIYYARKQVENGSVYVWGGQGELIRKLTVEKLAKMETSGYNAGRVEAHIKETLSKINNKGKIYDCSGLVICALAYAGVLPKKGYDDTAFGLYKTFEKITYSQVQPGDLAYKSDTSGDIVHVGLIVSPSEIVEAKGRDYGVVISKLNETWDLFNRPNYT